MPSRAPALSVPRMPTEIRYGPPAAGGRQRAKMVAEAVYHRHHAVSSTSAGRWRLELRRHRDLIPSTAHCLVAIIPCRGIPLEFEGCIGHGASPVGRGILQRCDATSYERYSHSFCRGTSTYMSRSSPHQSRRRTPPPTRRLLPMYLAGQGVAAARSVVQNMPREVWLHTGIRG
jgi:hypothetical protein